MFYIGKEKEEFIPEILLGSGTEGKVYYNKDSNEAVKIFYTFNGYDALMDEDEALKRCDKIDTFENKEFLEKTRENYLKLVKTEKNIVKIDATPTEDVVQDEIRNQIIKYLKL